MSAEADVGFPGQGEVVGIENEDEVTRGWSTQRSWWPSPRVECTRIADRRGEWQTKVVYNKQVKCGAVPPKYELGSTGPGLSSNLHICRSGNGSRIAAEFVTYSNSELIRCVSSIGHTRSLCSSAAMVLSTLDSSSSTMISRSRMMRGKGGQISRVSLAGVLGVQRSRGLRRCGD
jgi:hypothetical protein